MDGNSRDNLDARRGYCIEVGNSVVQKMALEVREAVGMDSITNLELPELPYFFLTPGKPTQSAWMVSE